MRKRNSLLLLFLVSFFYSYSVHSQNELPADKIFEAVNNSIVVILAYDKDTNINQGSGVVINDKGYIITNYHVCDDAERIEIKHYDKTISNVTIVFKDEIKDIIILKVSGDEYKPIRVGTCKNLKAGQRVYAIGSPEGYENSISDGIISGFRYDENGIALIQMTTPITEGSSGGAVVNNRGELIGLSVSGQHEGNIYFAIPVDDILEDLYSNKIAVKVNEPPNYLAEGDKATKKNDFENAVIYFSKYLEKNHDDADAFYSRAFANMKLKRYKQAISDFSASLATKSENYEIYFFRANCYYSIRDYQSSIIDYTQAINLSPQFPELYYNRGYAYFKSKKYTECLKDWQIAINYKPEYTTELDPIIQKIKEDLDSSGD